MMLFICENVLSVYVYGPFLCLLPSTLHALPVYMLFVLQHSRCTLRAWPSAFNHVSKTNPTNTHPVTLTNQNTRVHTRKRIYTFEPKNRTGFSNETIYAAFELSTKPAKKKPPVRMGTTRGKWRIYTETKTPTTTKK